MYNDALSCLEIDLVISDILIANNICTVNDLWILKRNDLKNMGLNDSQINHVIIKMQLLGIDLNRKVYDKK